MIKRILLVILGCVVLAVPAWAGPIETFAEGCKTELETYCKDVLPGEGRLLACLYAHSDKVSGQCAYAVYDAAAQLERALAALQHIANECEDDLMKYCANVEIGEGRIVGCMKEHEKEVSASCIQAFKDTGQWY